MEISYRPGNYLSSSIRVDAELTAQAKAEREKAEKLAQSGQIGDRVDISEEGRKLQQSSLMSRLNGEDPDKSGRIAYGGSTEPQRLDGKNDDDDLAQRIRELQVQLREAMTRLQQARQELSEAQAKDTAELENRQSGQDPAAGGLESLQTGEAKKAAQQKVAAAQAEVNTLQEQLQKYLQEQAQEAAQQ